MILFYPAKPRIKSKDYNLLFKNKNMPVKNKRNLEVICNILSTTRNNITFDWDNNTKDFYVRIL